MNRHLRALIEVPLRAFAALTAPILGQMARGGVGSERYLKYGVLPVPLHFYQPVFDPDQIPDHVWRRKSELPGVDFDADAQLGLLERLAAFSGDCRWPERSADPCRYHYENSSFGLSSACLLHSFVRLLRPARVVEVGAGMSTLVLAGALELNELAGSPRAELTTIDPAPPPAVRALSASACRLRIAAVQELPLETFTSLQAGDLLFIDSSHVVRTGGDVNFLYLDVLPRLASGVVVHVHDIQLPYEYHRSYSATSRAARLYWTEQYLLQAFLALNGEFAVMLAGYWLQLEHSERFAELYPVWQADTHRPTTSFYIRRR